MRNGGGTDHIESFNNFFQCWLVEQDQFLNELVDVSKHYETNNNTPTTGSTSNGDHQVSKEQVLRPLIDKALDHYEKYYSAKSRLAKEDVLAIFAPCWMSQLEEAFLWIGGWRPSMAFHLLYSKSGLQFEARLSELLHGISTGDLGDLSPNQVVRVDELHMKTIREERQVTEKMAKLQETVADSSMVELSHKVTELIRSGDRMSEDEDEQVESNLASKEEGFEEMLDQADDLRLRTLIEVISILKPMQAVHFLIAAAELLLRVHDWGKKRDASRNQNRGGGGRDGVGHKVN